MDRVFPAERRVVRRAAAAARPGGRRADAAGRRLRRGGAAAPRARGGPQACSPTPDDVGAPGADPGGGGGRRGAAHAHLAVAVRLPRRRRRRQPRLPGRRRDAWRTPWVRGAGRAARRGRASFAPLPVQRVGVPGRRAGRASTRWPTSPRRCTPDADPFAVPPAEEPMRRRAVRRRVRPRRCALPFAERDDIDLVRSGDELVLTVGFAPPGPGAAERAAPLHRRRRRPRATGACGCASSPTRRCGGRCERRPTPVGGRLRREPVAAEAPRLFEARAGVGRAGRPPGTAVARRSRDRGARSPPGPRSAPSARSAR